MKALTKGQYEGIASVLAECKPLNTLDITYGLENAIHALIVVSMAHQFQASDPEFKRELFLAQCGVTE